MATLVSVKFVKWVDIMIDDDDLKNVEKIKYIAVDAINQSPIYYEPTFEYDDIPKEEWLHIKEKIKI